MARPRTAAADYQAVTIRLPQEIMARCQAEAVAVERSLNFMIVQIMRDWYARQSSSVPASPARKAAFDTKKYRLGDPCPDDPTHRYGDTGQSVRAITGGGCRLCTLAEKREAAHRQRQEG